jgi:hypothetical protein
MFDNSDYRRGPAENWWPLGLRGITWSIRAVNHSPCEKAKPKRIPSFHKTVFPWPHHERTLWTEFSRIQKEAGVHLPCHEDHEHTDACHLYGFHDLRRAFATMNAETLSGDAQQALIRHKTYATSKRYINMGRQLKRAVHKLHVPAVLKTSVG